MNERQPTSRHPSLCTKISHYTLFIVVSSYFSFFYLSRQKVDPLHDVNFCAGCERLQKCWSKYIHTLTQMTDRCTVTTTNARYLQLTHPFCKHCSATAPASVLFNSINTNRNFEKSWSANNISNQKVRYQITYRPKRTETLQTQIICLPLT